MRNVQMLRTEPNFVSVPLEHAVYCENCETVSNSRRDRCGVCGSEAILALAAMIGGVPPSPDPGAPSAAQIMPIFALERLSAA